jgi:methylated-DNA-[protein]-cysteine S-methyltransferase
MPHSIYGLTISRSRLPERRSELQLVLEKLPSPIGTILLVCEGETIRALDFDEFESRFMKLLRRHCGDAAVVEGKAPARIGNAIRAYFDGDIEVIDDLPTATGGTEFQRNVWAGLRIIPAGTTWSYGQLAKHVGKPQAMRAVGVANGSNPIAIVVPCHRVIGADGSLTGYGGGMPRKQWLLRHEGAFLA